MPVNVRNFWVDLSVDGRQNDVGTGPRSKDGGMLARFFIRDDGEVKAAITVRCDVMGDKLTLTVYDNSGQCESMIPITIVTQR